MVELTAGLMATKRPFAYKTDCRLTLEPEFWEAQWIPSLEVSTVPDSPTATIKPFALCATE